MIAQQSSTVTKNNKTDNTGTSKNCHASFYQSFKGSIISPISELNIHYQKNGFRESLKNCFIDFKSKFDDGTIWWRVMFRCPISGKIFHSSLPLSTLMKGRNILTKDDCNEGLHQIVCNDPSKVVQSSLHSDDVCGEFRMDNEYTYFKTVKNARKSVAIRVLENFSEGREKTMFHSIAEYQQQTGEKSIVGEDDLLTEKSNSEFGTKGKNDSVSNLVNEDVLKTEFMKKCPEWVNQLYDIGIDSTSFILEFKERLTEDANIRQKKPLCKSNPTLMFCRLSLYRPVTLTAESKSYQSKLNCITDVVDLVENEVRKKMSKQSLDAHIEEFKTKHENDEWAEKSKMVDMVPKLGTYVIHPPLCMTAPIFIPDANNHDEGTRKVQLYLYEIRLTTTNGESFFPKIGLDATALTRIGVVFGRDLFDYSNGESLHPDKVNELSVNQSVIESIRAEFNLSGCQISSGIISLTNRSVLECDKDKLNLLRAFNITLDSWQSYGMAKYPREVDAVKKLENTEWNKIIGSSRKCMFMPLRSISSHAQYYDCIMKDNNEQHIDVDWEMINSIMSCQKKMYIRPFDHSKEFKNIFGEFEIITLFYTSVLVALAVIIPNIYSIFFQDGRAECTITELVISIFALSFSGIFLFIYFIPPREEVPFSVLQNRFLLQRKAAPRIYVTNLIENKVEVKGTSSFPPRVLRNGEHESNRNKWKQPKTYADYYYSRYGVALRYPGRRLLNVCSIPSTKEAFPRTVESKDNQEKLPGLYIVPELITILPMPRDFIYFYHNLASFMQPLERSIILKGLEIRLHELKSNSFNCTVNAASQLFVSQASSKRLQINANSSRLLHLLEESTTLSPCIMYQRLEHIGDAVIGYFVTLNLVGRNYSLNWDSDDLGTIRNNALKNVVFFTSALKVGLTSILGVGTNKWESLYKQNTSLLLKKYTGTLRDEDHISLYNFVELSDKVLSDVLESILGAAFRAHDTQLIISILEELDVPLGEADLINTTDKTWYQAFGTCMGEGYPFENDSRWATQMQQVNSILLEREDIMLQLDTGWKGILQLLSKHCDIGPLHQNSEENPLKKMIVMCSLFDDSLGTDEYESNSELTGSLSGDLSLMEGLQSVALFRDNLFFLGHSALLLCTCNELFEMNPNASAGDLHLLRSCATSDDVLAYIAIKNGINEFLYDSEATSILLLKLEIEKSEKIGISTWNDNGGWFLEGGEKEFSRRWYSTNWSSSCASTINSVKPKYAGLVGGRLLGQKSKLPDKLTGDLSFSLKSLIGSFVMAYGLDMMWLYFLPLFKEVMIFTPDELRKEFSLISKLCSSYQKGHTSDILESYLTKRTTY